MNTSVSRINLRKIAAKYAIRRASTPKEPYDDSAAQVELLRVLEDSAPSIKRANRILDADSDTKEIATNVAEQAKNTTARRTY
jgi:TorA maturation chaperone TorD